MKLLSFVDSDDAFRFTGPLANRFPGVYVIVNLQRWLQPAQQVGSHYVASPNARAFHFEGSDPTTTWVDVVGPVQAMAA